MPSPDPPRDGPAVLAPTSGRDFAVRMALSVVLAVGFAAALWPYLRAIPPDLHVLPWALGVYLLILVPYNLLRAGRWHLLLRPLAPVPLRDSLRVSLAGYMWIALLPFRLGELARPILLARRSPIRVQRALGTVAIERVVDGLVIGGLFFVTGPLVASSTSDVSIESTTLYNAALGVMAVFFVALLGLLFMARWPRAMGGLIDATVGRPWPRLARWAAELSHGVASGLTALPRGGPLLWFVAVSLLYWGTNALGMWVLAQGCGLPITLGEAVLVMAVMNLALLVPGGPAQLGIFQTGVALGLHLVLPAETIRDDGSVFAFYLYVGQLGTIVAAGVWAQRSLGLGWRTALGRGTADAGDDADADDEADADDDADDHAPPTPPQEEEDRR